MRAIAYEKQDGGVVLVYPVRNTYPEPEEITDQEVEERAWNRLPEDAVNPIYIDADAIPKKRIFRDGWVLLDGQVVEDMEKCREIHTEILRKLRAPKMADLDIEFMRAVEDGDARKIQEISAKKQELRDVTNYPAISLAKTPDELSLAIPEILIV